VPRELKVNKVLLGLRELRELRVLKVLLELLEPKELRVLLGLPEQGVLLVRQVWEECLCFGTVVVL
jgi:hypothetical protein